MVWREQRTVTSALVLHYNKALFILEPTEISRPLAGKRVDVCEYPDGGLEIRHGDHTLPYRIFDKIRQVNRKRGLPTAATRPYRATSVRVSSSTA